jgi:hypothetical protein
MSDICTAAVGFVIHHLVSAGKQRRPHGEAERLGGFEPCTFAQTKRNLPTGVQEFLVHFLSAL